MVMYPRRMALRRVVLEGEPRERETYVAKAASLRLEMGGGVVGLMEKADIRETKLGMCGGVGGGSGWDVESPHVLVSLFRANEDGCRVSGGKYRE
jgi:hypothetical protein